MFLKVENLNKTYKRGKEFNAVDNINFVADLGDMIALIGKSGSGKTTFLNLISGILTPASGNIFIDNKNIFKLDDKERGFLRNNLIGFIPQSLIMLDSLTVIENICLPFYLFKREGNPITYAEELLDFLNIRYLCNIYPNELSGGELRRVSIARALINKPKIILADEPTSDLDIQNTKDVLKIFHTLNKDKKTIVIFATHDLQTISITDKVYTMINGKLIEGNNFLLKE